MYSSGKKKVSVGPYRFTGKILGKGNFARVEEAVHGILNIKVAIKIMDINQIKEDYVIRNLCREAQIMSRLNHPCIAALYQTMQKSDNVYYLVTELVSGGDLCTFVKGQRNGKLEERPTRIYARQFASALSHMHGFGVVHRDLKMENVMLNSIQTQIKIVDFGLSNVWSAQNPLRTHCGSPEYAAPELFVTGRQYGAEVDLWSLGIILYGMVTGQLPFVTNRSDHVSSQERRKKLVAQINKGLASSHRRVIASFSAEFRHLISKLLVPESSERLTTKGLMSHPWITEKGKKMIRTNPLKILDDRWKAKIISEIETLVQIDTNHIVNAVFQDRLGKIGGMFNILVHKQQLTQLIGDGITKHLPSINLVDIPELSRRSGKDPVLTKIPTARAANTKKPSTATGYCRKSELCTPREPEVLNNVKMPSDKSPKKSNKLKKNESTPSRIPTSANHASRKDPKFVDYRLITSPTLRRKAYSATITKNSRPRSPAEGASRPTSPVIGAQSDKEQITKEKKKTYEIQTPEKMHIQEINAVRKINSSRSKVKINLEGKIKEVKTRILGGIIEKSRSKSDQLKVKNTVSNQKPVKHERANITVSQSASRAADKTANSNLRHKTNESKKEIFNRQEPWERSVYAFGDSPVRAVTAPLKQTRIPAIYDPIAKSIADYVANNVPDKMNKISWYQR